MAYTTSDAVDAVFNNNASNFQDAVSDLLTDKLKERIGVEKVAVAQSFLNEPEIADDQEEQEVSDEDV
jgi:hypothetical protein